MEAGEGRALIPRESKERRDGERRGEAICFSTLQRKRRGGKRESPFVFCWGFLLPHSFWCASLPPPPPFFPPFQQVSKQQHGRERERERGKGFLEPFSSTVGSSDLSSPSATLGLCLTDATQLSQKRGRECLDVGGRGKEDSICIQHMHSLPDNTSTTNGTFISV